MTEESFFRESIFTKTWDDFISVLTTELKFDSWKKNTKFIMRIKFNNSFRDKIAAFKGNRMFAFLLNLNLLSKCSLHRQKQSKKMVSENDYKRKSMQ